MFSTNRTSFLFLHLLLLLLLFKHARSAGSRVRYLPGFSGELPFKLETGYITVNSTSELFYLFVESQGNPAVDPVLVYLVGGPGCSALNAFFYQSGPVHFNVSGYEGGLPSLYLYPHAWTKSASIIFVDAPVGSGYSYATDPDAYYIDDNAAAEQIYMFVRKWFEEYPQFIGNRFYVASDSYAGVFAPIVTLKILEDNEAGVTPYIDLIGLIEGSPHTNSDLEHNSLIPYYRNMALISESLYQAAKNDCNGDYVNVNSNNTACLEDLDAIDVCVADIYTMMVIEPNCNTDSVLPDHPDIQSARRSLHATNSRKLRKKTRKFSDQSFPLAYTNDDDDDDTYFCRNFKYLLSYIWANDEAVKEALHVRNGTIKTWYRCNLTLTGETYDYTVLNAMPYQKNLTKYSISVLLYSGDHDTVVSHISTEEWIDNLGITLDSDWRPWYVDGQVAGYTMKYTDYGYALTYATVKGSGHSPTEYKGLWCNNMFERFIHRYPL